MSMDYSEQDLEEFVLEARRMTKLSKKAAILLMWKAGKGYFELGYRYKASECFEHALQLVTAELTQEDNTHKDGSEMKDGSKPDKRKIIDARHAARRWKKAYEQIKAEEELKDIDSQSQCTDRNSMASSTSESDDESKIEQFIIKRKMVLEELLATEESFVADVKYITERVQPLFALETTSSVLKVNTASIFGNILELYKFHCRFLKELKATLSEVPKLGQLFSENKEYFSDIYSRYCRGKPAADDIMDDHKDEIELLFRTYLKGQRLALNDYLIKPVQRLMKYQLLLSLVLKYTEKAGEDCEDIKNAVDVMKIIPKQANNRMNIAMIVDYNKHLSEDQLILQDNLDVSFGRFKHKLRSCRVFLFKEYFVVTEIVERPGRLPQFRFIAEGKTAKMGLTTSIHNDKLKFAVWFRKFNSTDIFVCKSDCLDGKQSWLKAVKELITTQRTDTKGETDIVEPDFQSSQIRRVQSWSANEFVRRSTLGHPREREMSGRLKTNIERFLTEEYHMTSAELKTTNSLDETSKLANYASPRLLHRHETFGCSSVVSSPDRNLDQLDLDQITFEGTESESEESDAHFEAEKSPRDKHALTRCLSPYENVPDQPRQNHDAASSERGICCEGNNDNGNSCYADDAERLASHEKTSVKVSADSNNNNKESNNNNESNINNNSNNSKVNSNNNNSNGIGDVLKQSSQNDCIAKDTKTGDDITNNNHEVKKKGKCKTVTKNDVTKSNGTMDVIHEVDVTSSVDHAGSTRSGIGRGRTISDAAILCWVETVGDCALHTLCQRSSELLLLRSIESESRYHMANLISTTERDNKDLQFYSEALSLFLPVKKLFSISMRYATRSDIVTPVSSLYSQLKGHRGYISKTSNQSHNDECTFFSYDGLSRLLQDFSRATNRACAVKMSIVLTTAAVVMATTESHWDDALSLYEHLSHLFAQDDHNDCAVDCLVDAYFISLENGDMAVACSALAKALQLALAKSNQEVIERVVDLANSLDPSCDESGQLIDLIDKVTVNCKALKAC